MIDIALTGEIAGSLEDSTATMQEIANYFSFPDQSSMAKFFKRNTGYTLTEYRHNHCRHFK